jgi:Fe-S-cluster-containing hydrogenase component 2
MLLGKWILDILTTGKARVIIFCLRTTPAECTRQHVLRGLLSHTHLKYIIIMSDTYLNLNPELLKQVQRKDMPCYTACFHFSLSERYGSIWKQRKHKCLGPAWRVCVDVLFAIAFFPAQMLRIFVVSF